MKQVSGHILTSDGFVAGTLEVRSDGRIAGISGKAIEPARLREAPIVLPGFIDLHVHGGEGTT
jgi:N-acetylglucosamine-6-phosphate deacetylase